MPDAEGFTPAVTDGGAMAVRRPGRVRRVPYETARQLVGESILRKGCPDERTFRYNWQTVGVPPEKLCWMLIDRLRAKTATAPVAPADSEIIEQVRSIAARTEEQGPLWDTLRGVVEMTHRQVRRAGPR